MGCLGGNLCLWGPERFFSVVRNTESTYAFSGRADFEEKEKALKSLSPTISRHYKNEADATRTRNLRIDSPIMRFVSVCGKSVYDCKIKTYEMDGKPK